MVGEWVAGLRWHDVPARVRDRLGLVLRDTIGVCLTGAREPEQTRLIDAWRPAPGPAPLLGAGRTTTVEASAWLNAVALVRLELDEGHKYARGHPAAHAFPAVLALAADLGADGPDTMAALLAGYEVGARYGRATRLRPGAHPHGSWGVAGAAAGCARLLGLADRVAAYGWADSFDGVRVLDLDVHAIADAERWIAAAGAAVESFGPGAAVVNGCSAVDVPGRRAVDPTALALRLLAAGGI